MTPMIDVIVPYGHVHAQPERHRNLVTVLTGLRRSLTYPNYRLILAEMGKVPTQRPLATELDAEYLFTASDAEFSPGAAMNAGFTRRPHPQQLVYFHQADFLVPADVLDVATDIHKKLKCPFVYPYWAEVHLSRPVSDAIRGNPRRQSALLDDLEPVVARWRDQPGRPVLTAQTCGHDEIIPRVADADPLRKHYPEIDWRRIDQQPHTALWGHDDREYAPYRWESNTAAHASLWRISSGPRASAAYLCTDTAFRRIGGIPELPGWGYEDLLCWLTVQAFYPYTSTAEAIRFRDAAMSQNKPLVHLWHPVSNRRSYYQSTSGNERRYLTFLEMSHQQRRSTVTPLPGQEPYDSEKQSGLPPAEMRVHA